MMDRLSGTATAPPVPVPKLATSSPAIINPDRATISVPEREGTKAASQTTGPLQGFNPALSIDPQSHVVVMTFSDPGGKVIQQTPTKQQLAAYNGRADKT